MNNSKSNKPSVGVRFKNWTKSIWTELRFRVTWPGPKELAKSSVTVLVFVVLWAAYIGVFDYLFAGALNWLIK